MNGLPTLTDSSRRTLALAMTTAGRVNATTIAPEHVLVGLLLEPTQEARSVLVRAGVDPARLADLQRQLAPTIGYSVPGIGAGIPYAPSTKQAIIAACSEARLDGADLASPQHLLRGLLHESETVAALALHAAGVTLETLRKARAENGAS